MIDKEFGTIPKETEWVAPQCNECGEFLTMAEIGVCHKEKIDPFDKDTVCSICWAEGKHELIKVVENNYGGPNKWPTGCKPTDTDSEEVFTDIWNAAIDQAIKDIKEWL